MFSIVSDSDEDLPDVSSFVAGLNDFNSANNFFNSAREIFLARAPGRLDLMGGIADYSGSLVLQYPIREATFAALQKDSSPTIRVVSVPPETGEKSAALSFEISLDELKDGELSDYVSARRFFADDSANHWAAYVVGVFLILMRERRINFVEGARLYIASNVPEGKGVSSSAALEAATMQAVNAAFDLNLTARQLALLCQKTENEIVGAPCGVMDQMVSACGETNELLALLCQPAELVGAAKLPAGIEIWGIDSGIRHSIAGADYGSVRAGAFIGYRMIAEIAGLKVEKLENNLVEIADDKWHGYLANIAPGEFEGKFRARLPEKITGGEFLKKYHGTTDKITVVEPEKEYAVLAPTAHPIDENARVREFARLLRENQDEITLPKLGELMYQSHAGYSGCGLGSDGTDSLVELIKQTGASGGLYGAKITGGGSGGTVAVLGRGGAGEAVEYVAANYYKQSGYRPRVFSGSSPGAFAFGFRLLKAA